MKGLVKMEFASLRELYARIEPALEAKRMEMIRSGYSYIKKEDIWNYLKEVKWKSSTDLSLAEMVNDILNSDSEIIDDHLKNTLKRSRRSAYLNEE